MKQLLTTALLSATTLMITGSAFAHGGHVTNNSVHSFLHVEHIVVLVVIGIVGYLLKTLNDK